MLRFIGRLYKTHYKTFSFLMSLSLEEGETRQLAEERGDGERGWGRGGGSVGLYEG